MKLSERIKDSRTDRLDEWSMDELARDVAKLEGELAGQKKAIQGSALTCSLLLSANERLKSNFNDLKNIVSKCEDDDICIVKALQYIRRLGKIE